MDIGFIGLGQMGAAMAINLVSAGHNLTVFNRSREKVDPLVAAGARAVDTPAEAAAGDLVVTMLSDDAAVEHVTFGQDGIVGCPAIHVSMSTISLALVERLTSEAAGRIVSAPVFGRPDAAAAGKLFVVAAGPASIVGRCAPLFETIGQRTFNVGERPVAANVIKLCGNFSIMAMAEAMAEAMTLAEMNGVERHTMTDVLSNTLFPGGAYANYGRIMVEERYVPAGFPAILGLKDMDLVGQAAMASRTPMPFLSIVRDHFLALLAQGDGDIDWAGIARVVRRQAGLE